jgi:hypothetical protein
MTGASPVGQVASSPSYVPGQTNSVTVGANPAVTVNQPVGGQVPTVVTQVNVNGTPTAGFGMANVGFNDTDPTTSTPGHLMKAAFSDFLKLRHGGSGFLFAFGMGSVGDPNPNIPTTGVASERPFHALSFPDIDYTVMRPASLPPSPSTFLPSNPTYTAPMATWPASSVAWPNTQPTGGGLIIDPGQRNPYYFTQPSALPPTTLPPNFNPTGAVNAAGPPPSIPAQRLFQIADARGTSNASDGGDNNVNNQTQIALNVGGVQVNLLYNNDCDLMLPKLDPAVFPNNVDAAAAPPFDISLGGNGGQDRRQHPYFRTEWLQKIMNLTTVRTHQYAVWITVGFFEVTQQGDPLLANSAQGYQLAYDQLGMELNALSGRNIRYRSFFIIDRTKLVGFNPIAPGDFRNAVIYRQTIE